MPVEDIQNIDGQEQLLEFIQYVENEMIKFDIIIDPPIDNVSVVLCAYNEETFIERCAKSLRNQSIIKKYPENFEIILVDNECTDKTVELANPYMDRILRAPRGKLFARNLGIDNSTGNIIVSADADVIYPEHWLNTLLKPFSEPQIAGVYGSVFDYTIPTIPGQFYTLIGTIMRLIMYPKRMAGINSAFWKHLFYKVGKFDTSINQFDVDQMVQEEEVGFGDKLSEYGDIIFKINASCIHLGGYKFACRQGTGPSEICDSMKFGIERFDKFNDLYKLFCNDTTIK